MSRIYRVTRSCIFLYLAMSVHGPESRAQWGCAAGGCESEGLAPVVQSSDAGLILQELGTTKSKASGQVLPGDLRPLSAGGSAGPVGSHQSVAAEASHGGTSCGAMASGADCYALWQSEGCLPECAAGTCAADCFACGADPCGSPSCGGSLMGFEFFGEYLYLRPRNAEVAYAMPVDGPLTPVLDNGIPIGDVRVVDIDYQSGFRAGFSAVTTICGRLNAQWTRFQSSDSDQAAISTPDVLRSLVTFPLAGNVAYDGLQTSANLDIDFDLIDMAVQTPLCRRRCWAADVLWGVRYGRLQQQFDSQIDVNGQTFVNTDIDFDGVGPRVGLLGQRNLGRGSLYAYGRGESSFLLGTFDATYLQQDAFAGEVVNTGWESGRVVPQLEMELGLGWCTPGGRFQMRAGYLVSAWFNAVRTNEFIHAVQEGYLNGMGDGISFDGLSVRAELRF